MQKPESLRRRIRLAAVAVLGAVVMLGNAAAAQAGTAPPVPATPTPTASGPLQSADPASKPPTNPTPADSTGPSAESSASDAAVLAADDDWTVEDAIRF
ncbi:hypothetical protein ACFV2U_51535 [Streptomyces sp. NPDC059697]|uniref:hypothetical protein n=1 Tax=Streptomyces sp. NPDC059697 TaxID=3346912 RepID=UPI0036C45607